MKPRSRTLALGAAALLALVVAISLLLALVEHPERARAEGFQDSWSGWIPGWMQRGSLTPALQSQASQTIEICGYGHVAAKAPDDLPAEFRRSLEQPSIAFANTAEALASAPDAAQRATGLLLRSFLAETSALRSALNAKGCREDMGCFTSAKDTAAAAGQSDRNALTQLAEVSNDPVAAAFVAQLCLPPNDCRQPVERWTRADPDNAAAWLALAQLAFAGGDDIVGEQALRRAADAPRADNYLERLFLPWASVEMSRAPPLDVLRADLVMPNLFVILPPPQYAWLAIGQCGAARVVDVDRRAVCDRIATVLAERGRSLLGQRIGEMIGKRVGWPEERYERTRRLMDAFAVLIAGNGSGAQDVRTFSCEVLAQHRQYWTDWSDGGEAEAMKRAIQRAGTTVEQLLSSAPRRSPGLQPSQR